MACVASSCGRISGRDSARRCPDVYAVRAYHRRGGGRRTGEIARLGRFVPPPGARSQSRNLESSYAWLREDRSRKQKWHRGRANEWGESQGWGGGDGPARHPDHRQLREAPQSTRQNQPIPVGKPAVENQCDEIKNPFPDRPRGFNAKARRRKDARKRRGGGPRSESGKRRSNRPQSGTENKEKRAVYGCSDRLTTHQTIFAR